MSPPDAYRAFEAAEQQLFEAYGVPYRSQFLELRDPAVRTRVIEAGSGPPVLFVHGGGSVGALWVPLVARLSGWRMLVVDRPGCGLSGAFDYTGVDVRRHAVAFLDALIEALGLAPVPIVASSMGGAWALRLAQARPERVRALALLGCPALLLDTSAPLLMRLLATRGVGAPLWSLRKPSAAFMKDLHRMMGHRPEVMDALPDAFWETLSRSVLLPSWRPAFRSLLRQVLGPFGACPGQSIGEDTLRAVSKPTLVIWGQDDAFGGPEVGRRAAGLMPDATLEVVPGGHHPWLDAPEKTGELVGAFLAARGA